MTDVTSASREELIALILAQQGQIETLQASIVQLQERIRELEARLGKGRPQGMPGNKPASVKGPERKTTRKPRPHGFARVRMTPTERVEHAVESCPECGTRLGGGWVQRTREVIELPIMPVKVTEHVFIARLCPTCRKRRVPQVELGGVVMGKQRLGVGLVSLIVTLREEGRLPFATIQWYLSTLYQLHLSLGGIVGVIYQVAGKAQKAVEAVRDRIRASPVVHADETGWREDGVNGYVWTFSTATERYFVRGRRDKGMVDRVLGDAFSGVLVSDFYAAYNHYEELKQRCWAHLLRDIHDLQELYPEDGGVRNWAGAVQELYQEAKSYSSPKEVERLAAKREFEQRLMQICAPYLKNEGAAQQRLCKRIERFLPELFVFVAYPEVPSENNAAERSLRHLVTSRKISCGTRSDQGTETKMLLSSLFGTWRAQGINTFLACLQLLSSP